MSEVLVIVPVRMESSRLKEKMMRQVDGIALFHHTYKSISYNLITCVATDSDVVLEYCRKHRINAIRTGHHENGTDRVAEAAKLKGMKDEDVIINLQGDEPEISAEAILKGLNEYKAFRSADMATLVTPLKVSDRFKESVVKVHSDTKGYASAFYRRPTENISGFRHIGVYYYSYQFLNWFVSTPQTETEKYYKLEQLRALNHGARIRTVIVDHDGNAVDTQEDFDQFEQRYKRAREEETKRQENANRRLVFTELNGEDPGQAGMRPSCIVGRNSGAA